VPTAQPHRDPRIIAANFNRQDRQKRPCAPRTQSGEHSIRGLTEFTSAKDVTGDDRRFSHAVTVALDLFARCSAHRPRLISQDDQFGDQAPAGIAGTVTVRRSTMTMPRPGLSEMARDNRESFDYPHAADALA
jgi:hypothetical protein